MVTPDADAVGSKFRQDVHFRRDAPGKTEVFRPHVVVPSARCPKHLRLQQKASFSRESTVDVRIFVRAAVSSASC
jgi:hypothetical protein